MAGLRMVDLTPGPVDPYERIGSVLVPAFLQPSYTPTPDDAVLWGQRCSIDSCEGWNTYGTPRLCAHHRKRLRYTRTSLTNRPGPNRGEDLTRESFVGDAMLHGGGIMNDHPGFDFTGLPKTLELELRLFVQTRHQQESTHLNGYDYATIKRNALSAGLHSLIPPGLLAEDRWLPGMPMPDAFSRASNMIKAHVKFAISLILDTGWPVPLMDRDRWYEHDFGATGSRTKTITWTGFKQQWLKNWAKQWVSYRLAASWKFNSAVSSAGRLLPFSRFLAEQHPEISGPQDLRRQTLLDYVAWVKRTSNIAASQRQGLVSTVKILIEDHRLNQWTPHIPESTTLRFGELPKREEMLPRPIQDHLLRQILDEENLTKARADLRTQLLILDGHGLRIGSIVELRIDCIDQDADGFPTLRYRNTKRSRERMHPIRDPRIVTAIQEQQKRATTRHPDTPWLFPDVVGNARGQLHTTTSAMRLALDEYIKRINLVDREGRPARVTPHQFRHTFGTRELNNGVPQEVVQELLDHDDPAVTRGYARLSGNRLREEFLSATRFNSAGQQLDSLVPDSPLSDLAWMKERLNRARVTLPNGYCALPLQQTCEVQNACLDCTEYFVTTPEFIPAHEAQRQRTVELIDSAEKAGQTRIVEKNRKVLVKLEDLLASLRDAK
jgi:integrase